MRADKKVSHTNRHRAIKLSTKIAAKPVHPARANMKNQGKINMPSQTLQTTLELDYARLFPVPQTPQQCFYADDYDLRQPSALKYVPSTTSPTAEV